MQYKNLVRMCYSSVEAEAEIDSEGGIHTAGSEGEIGCGLSIKGIIGWRKIF